MAGPRRKQSALATSGHTASASSSGFGSSSGDPYSLGGVRPPVALVRSLPVGTQNGYAAAPASPFWPSADPYTFGDLGAFSAAESQALQQPGFQASSVVPSNDPRGVDFDHQSEGQTFDNTTKFWL